MVLRRYYNSVLKGLRRSSDAEQQPLALAPAPVDDALHVLQQRQWQWQWQPHPPDTAFLLLDASTTFATPLRTRKAAPATARILTALEASRLLSAIDAIARARGSWICGAAWRSNEWSTLAAILSPSALSPSSDSGLPMLWYSPD